MGYQVRLKTKSPAKGGRGSFLRLVAVNRKKHPYKWRIYKRTGESPAEKELDVLPPARSYENWPYFLQRLGLNGEIFVYKMGGSKTLGWKQLKNDLKPVRIGLVKVVWKGNT